MSRCCKRMAWRSRELQEIKKRPCTVGGVFFDAGFRIYKPAARRKASALLVSSQGKRISSLPKWPYAAVLR